jgi:hypothetical protein
MRTLGPVAADSGSCIDGAAIVSISPRLALPPNKAVLSASAIAVADG